MDRDELVSLMMENKLSRLERNKLINVKLVKKKCDKQEKLDELFKGITNKLNNYDEIVATLLEKIEELSEKLVQEHERAEDAEKTLEEVVGERD